MSEFWKIILIIVSVLALGIAAFTGNNKNAEQESILPQAYEQVNEIHRTFNGKLDRKFYRQNS